MAEKVIFSNNIKSLLENLKEEINNQNADVFTKDWVITQTAGISQWFAVEIAKKEHNGVFANFAIINQDGFIRELYRFLSNGEEPLGNYEAARWIIFRLLGSEEFVSNPEYRHVSDYYSNDGFKRFQLAERIADLFDQYQIYREELINQWNSGKLMYDEPEMESWQRWLWLKLSENNLFISRHKISLFLTESFKDQENQEKIRAKFPAVNLFGNSVYTPYHLNIFRELAKVTSVNHFIVIPSEKMNDTGQDTNDLLKRWGENHAELASQFDMGDTNFNMPESKSVLGTIQRMITENINSGLVLPEIDDSIQINSAYTPAREVEMLYNYLVDLKSRNKDLQPGEILIMTTDMDLYAPYIKAVFKSPVYRIPYNLLGVSAGQKDSVITALLDILDFEERDFTSENVLGLLDNNCIASNYAINDMDKLRSLVDKAYIRFGFEDSPGSSNNESRYASWDFGLRKLAYGYAMLSNDFYEKDETEDRVYPFNDIDANGGQEILKLIAFVRHLKQVVIEKSEGKVKTIPEWREFVVEKVLEQMIRTEHEDKPDLAVIYQQLNRLSIADLMKDNDGEDLKIDFRTFYQSIKESLKNQQAEFGFNSGKVTVTSFTPARGLPAKVIAMLGMNSGIFPRKDQPFGFDLLSRFPEAGDRSRKRSDKMLFMETVMSAREFLYISYIGREIKDNSPRPPSIVVDQLLDFIERIIKNQSRVRKGLLQEHPLHGFSSKYQTDNKRLFTYLFRENKGRFFSDKAVSVNDYKVREINISRIIKFLKNPVEGYYNSIGVFLTENEDYIPETEMMEPDTLQEWELKKEYMENRHEDEILVNRLKMEGKLPPGVAGNILFRKTREETDELKQRYLKAVNGKKQSRKQVRIPMNIRVNDDNNIAVTAYGMINTIFDGTENISYCLSKDIKHKDKVKVIMEHILLASSGERITSKCLGLTEKNDFYYDSVNQESAYDKLKDIMTLYFKSLDKMILYDDDIKEDIKNYFKANEPDGSGEKANEIKNGILKKIRDKAYPSKKNSFVNPYLKQAVDENLYEDYFDELIENTNKINELLNL